MRTLTFLFGLLLSTAVGATGTIPLSIQIIGAGPPVVQPLCATARAGDVFTGVTIGVCDTPPNPPHDPNAISPIVAKYALHTPPCVATIADGENFFALFGHSMGFPDIGQWPGRPNTSVFISIPGGPRYYGGVFTDPQNPGITPHTLKGDLYAGSGVCASTSPTGVTVNVSVLPVNGSRPPVGNCGGARAFGSPWVTFAPNNAPNSQPTNMTVCNVFMGGQYRVVVDPIDSTRVLGAILTWN